MNDRDNKPVDFSPDNEDSRQQNISALDDRMKRLADRCSETSVLFDQIIELEESLDVKFLRYKTRQFSIGYAGVGRIRSGLWGHRGKLNDYSLEQLRELTEQVETLEQGVVVLQGIFERHLERLNNAQRTGSSFRVCYVEILRALNSDVMSNVEILSALRSLTGENLHDVISRNRSGILKVLLVVSALGIGAIRGCDGCDHEPVKGTTTTDLRGRP